MNVSPLGTILVAEDNASTAALRELLAKWLGPVAPPDLAVAMHS